MSGLAPMHVIPSASEGPRLNSWITQVGFQHCIRESLTPKAFGFGITRAMLQLKARRQFDFASDRLKNYRKEFVTS